MKTAKAIHPDETALLRHAAADESRAEGAAVGQHLVACGACRRRLETIERVHAGLTEISKGQKRTAKRPVTVGRSAAYRRRIGDLFAQARQADRASDGILNAAKAGEDKLRSAIGEFNETPWCGLALLFSARKGPLLVGIDPRLALELARALLAEAHVGDETFADQKSIQVRALLLQSQALSASGEPREGRASARRARALLKEVAAPGLLGALCDYYEGEAANFERDYPAAEKLLRSAKETFAESGAERFLARSNAALGTMLGSRGDCESALPYFEQAILTLDLQEDARALAATLNNMGNSLARLGRFEEARSTYRRALVINLRHRFLSNLRLVRTSLAELDLSQGHHAKALRAFEEVVTESTLNGSAADVLFARLYVAECLGRMNRFEELAGEVEAMRRTRRKTPFGPSPALEDLFICLDKGSIDADLVKHVREYLQDAERGVKTSYRALRRA